MNRKIRLTACLLALLLILSAASASVFAAEYIIPGGIQYESRHEKPDPATVITLQIGNPEMTVNGETRLIDQEGTTPCIINGRTMLPIRAIVEALGGSVEWYAESRTVSMLCNDTYVMMTIGDVNAQVIRQSSNTSLLIMDTAPIIRNNRTLLPVRAVTESFGAEVEWDAETKTVTINAW